MFLVSNLLLALAKITDILLSLYMWIIIFRAIMSWVSIDPYNPVVKFLISVTEPVLYPIRSRMPGTLGGVDLSPMIVVVAIVFLQTFVVRSVIHLAMRLG